MGVVKKVEKLLKLEQMCSDQCPERNVMSYLRLWNKKLQMDGYWNLFLINEWTPLICAHMDTVQKTTDVAKVCTIRNRDWKIKWDNIIIWADDKAWIALAMEMYEWFGDKISLLFTRQEETGCNWSRYFCDTHPDLVRKCTYCLVLDRKNSWDIIGYQNWYCWKEFDEALSAHMKEWWYKSVVGWISDTGNISKLINAVNLSIGYYNLHTQNEYLEVSEFETAAYAIADVIENFQWADYPLYVAPAKSSVNITKKYTSRDKYGGSLFSRLSIYDYFESVDDTTIKLKKDICLYNNSKTFILSKGEYTLEDIEMEEDLGIYY